MTAYQASSACSANFPVVFQLGPEALRVLEGVVVKPPEWAAPHSGALHHVAKHYVHSGAVHDVHDVPITSGIPTDESLFFGGRDDMYKDTPSTSPGAAPILIYENANV